MIKNKTMNLMSLFFKRYVSLRILRIKKIFLDLKDMSLMKNHNRLANSQASKLIRYLMLNAYLRKNWFKNLKLQKKMKVTIAAYFSLLLKLMCSMGVLHSSINFLNSFQRSLEKEH